MVYEDELKAIQKEHEEEAREIIRNKRDYSNWKQYMGAQCKVADSCTTPMCPLDVRLTRKEKEDAVFICKVQGRAVKKKPNSLTKFVRTYCANYDQKEDLCIGQERTGTCLIMQGKPCQYFKESVWPICNPDYKFATETRQYPKLLAIYKKIDPNILESDTSFRRCNCGEVLKFRQKLCNECRKKARRKTKRLYQQKYRVQRSTVNEKAVS